MIKKQSGMTLLNMANVQIKSPNKKPMLRRINTKSTTKKAVPHSRVFTASFGNSKFSSPNTKFIRLM